VEREMPERNQCQADVSRSGATPIFQSARHSGPGRPMVRRHTGEDGTSSRIFCPAGVPDEMKTMFERNRRRRRSRIRDQSGIHIRTRDEVPSASGESEAWNSVSADDRPATTTARLGHGQFGDDFAADQCDGSCADTSVMR